METPGMRNRRTIPIYIAGVALSGLLLYCNPKNETATTRNPNIRTDQTATEGRVELKAGEAKPKQVEGGRYPAVKPDLNEKLNEEKPVYVPNGPDRGQRKPANKECTPRP